MAALGALGFLGLSSSAAVEVLTDALSDASGEIKSAAASALGMLGASSAWGGYRKMVEKHRKTIENH